MDHERSPAKSLGSRVVSCCKQQLRHLKIERSLHSWLLPAGGVSLFLCILLYLFSIRGSESSTPQSIYLHPTVVTQPACSLTPHGCPVGMSSLRIFAGVQAGTRGVDCDKALQLTHVSGSNESDPTGSFLFKVACLLDVVQRTPPGEIPRIIHQSWFPEGTSPRPQFQKWQTAWVANHPDWKYVLWSDADYNKLVQMFYPWLLGTFEGFEHEIQRSDTARYVYMHLFGGMYADMDFYSLQPMDPLLQGQGLQVVVGAMASSEDNEAFEPWLQEHNIPNAWMASTPGQQLWLFCLHRVIRKSAEYGAVGEPEYYAVETSTGPGVLYHTVAEYQARKMQPRVTILEPPAIYPVDWRNRTEPACRQWKKGFNEEDCKAAFHGEAYAITYFSHSWGCADAEINC